MVTVDEVPLQSVPWLLGRLEVPLEPRSVGWKLLVLKMEKNRLDFH